MRRGRRRYIPRGAITHPLLPLRSLRRQALLLGGDVVVGDAVGAESAGAARLVGGFERVEVGFWVFGDDVPGVQEAGEVAEEAEEDVDEGVGGAEAAFDPDWQVLGQCWGKLWRG